MRIESPEAFEAFLTHELDRISDNSKDLTPYVTALVKKNMAPDALKAHCAEQLFVFLDNNTHPFLDVLFNYLENQSTAASSSHAPPETSSREEPAKVISPAREYSRDRDRERDRDRGDRDRDRERRDSSREDRRREYRRDLDDDDRDYRRRGRSPTDYVSARCLLC